MWKQTCIFLTFFSRNLQGTNQVLLILHFLPLNNQFDKNPSVLLMLFSNDCFNIFASMIFILVPNIISLTSKFNLGHCYSYHAYLHVYLYHIHVELCLTCQKETSLWSPKESERFRGSSNFVALLLSIFKSFALIKLYRQNSPTAIVITSSPMKCKST